jgi:hypothetical protein
MKLKEQSLLSCTDTHKKKESKEEVEEGITTKTDPGTYKIRFYKMLELEYKAILGYKFLKRTNTKKIRNKEGEEKTNSVKTRNLQKAARELTEKIAILKKITFLQHHQPVDLTTEMIWNKQSLFKKIYSSCKMSRKH